MPGLVIAEISTGTGL